jgi:hypothetical protein
MKKKEAFNTNNKNTKLFISLRDNYAANFGHVYRSSAIFWVVNNEKIKTTICLSDYWRYKNNLAVSVVVNLRNLKGELVSRDVISFSDSLVKNYVPPFEFSGTVEVEAFSSENLRIPYAAVMAVYEASESISMVHSYARSYSQHEIEENRMIAKGRESCWSLRDSSDWRSFCIIHNGSQIVEPQLVTLNVRTFDGVEHSVDFEIGPLQPFETIVIEPLDYFHNLPYLLNGQPGNARLSFQLGAGFTRMLCGVRTNDWAQVQITHSNFDYSLHDTDIIDAEDKNAYFYIPNINKPQLKSEVIVYPDRFSGIYTIAEIDGKSVINENDIYRKTFNDASARRFVFSAESELMPTRIVTGLRLYGNENIIPAECSLNTSHQEIPPKRFSWMLVSSKFNSIITWVDLIDVYGGCDNNSDFVFHLYSSSSKEALKEKVIYSKINNKGNIKLEDIFGPDVKNFLNDQFGYLTVWSSYPGFMFFSTLSKKDSITIEHCF